MKKITTLFARNMETDRRVRDEIAPGAEWVANGEGVPTIKVDGVCTLVRDGQLYRRFTEQAPGYMVGGGKTRKPQTHSMFEPTSDLDPNTGKREGWIPVGDGPEDQYLRAAFADFSTKMGSTLAGFEGTCEFLGPKSQGNVESVPAHILLPHAWCEPIPDAPRTFEALRDYLGERDIEGIVWHHPDGRMVKIKGKDFGHKRRRRHEDPAAR
jgi:hypothetical protein